MEAGTPSLSRGAERVLCVAFGAAAATIYFHLSARKRASSGPPKAPLESTIRLMTRLAIKHGAVNLSQGFPNEPPPRAMVLAAAGALIDGESLESAAAAAAKLDALLPPASEAPKDQLNQYSFPFGAPVLRAAIAKYYGEFYPEVPADAEENLTVCLGATEGFAISLRALCSPGDTIVFFQPFHELYPNQCTIWGLRPKAVTLYERANGWIYDEQELEAALRGARCLLFNSPHNPTGKVFTDGELRQIAALCMRHDVMVVTDEIYEHMCFDGTHHTCMAQLPGMAERTLVVSALSKTARATGWRVGWVVSPARFTPTIRAVHDQLVLQAPTPLQVGAAAMLSQDRAAFDIVASEYLEKRTILFNALQNAGFTVGSPPQGAYYLFVGYHSVPALRGLTPREAAMKLTETYKVACVPGDNCYLDHAAKVDRSRGGGYLRFTFVRSVDVLEAAAKNLKSLRAASP
eukprot:TRINITY_DN26389_c0_g1_i1.p1 TRINITY_DN26389_c0_g1~~TRINITY_DN26389_c0_g1_i1.p1  ORF type:complete len:462 (-),score=51.87 TRINITY_DN26389_c0_g1_i1:75-1460(-)